MSQSPSVRGPLDHAAARRLIDAFLVDDLLAQDAARLAAHVKECPACAAEIGGTTRLLALLGSLPTPPPAPDLDERIYAAVIADRARRHDHRSWLANLRTQVLRGAVRTTGTLMVAIVTVAFLGGAFVLAAAAFLTQPAPTPTPHVTVAPDMTPTPAPTKVESTAPAATPPAVVATPAPTAEAGGHPRTNPGSVAQPVASPSSRNPARLPRRRPARPRNRRPPPRHLQPRRRRRSHGGPLRHRSARRRPQPRRPQKRRPPHRRNCEAGRARHAVPGLAQGNGTDESRIGRHDERSPRTDPHPGADSPGSRNRP